MSKFALKNEATAVRKLQAEADDKNISVEQLTSLILSKHFNVFRASQQLNIAEKKALADIKAANSKNELEIIITNFEKWSKKDESPNLKTVQIIRRMETNFRK
ncbi:hypothetical protein CVPH_0181 [Abyssogena phaseoliformis symbiont OG214]|uniref:hypothetical protein n=1 Tax=Abyssogena phaseoliformis symbiont TaxID=596095 RepID=UPI0019160853|nr:hypothetical protein [Abyssogena phaseoliformis symbiont]BBB22352.1 hypothetical protein CVPH_0181 [Abyssogena phaseoliformis symbiont OG214]